MNKYAPVEISKKQLRHLNRTAILLDYNRSLIPEFFDTVAAEDKFVIAPFMMHEHAQTKLVEPHLRCRIYLIQGEAHEDRIEIGWIDIRLEDYPTYVAEPIEKSYSKFAKKQYDRRVAKRKSDPNAQKTPFNTDIIAEQVPSHLVDGKVVPKQADETPELEKKGEV